MKLFALLIIAVCGLSHGMLIQPALANTELPPSGSLRCATKPPYLSIYQRVARTQLEDQLERAGYQRVRVAVTFSRRAVSNARADQSTATFGAGLRFTLNNNNEIQSLNVTRVTPNATVCDYVYRMRVTARYLNAQGRSVSKRSEAQVQLSAPLIYSSR